MATLRDKARASAGKSSGGLRAKAKSTVRRKSPDLDVGPEEPTPAMPVNISPPDQVSIIPEFSYLKLLAKIPALRRRRDGG